MLFRDTLDGRRLRVRHITMRSSRLLLFLLGAAPTAFAASGTTADRASSLFSRRAEHGSCLGGGAPTVKAPKTNVWSNLSPEDNVAVWDWLHSSKSGLNLTLPESATLSDNYVYWIDALHTNKSAVLPYIDGKGPAPPKYARAIVFEGAIAEPRSQEYMIGPLPVSSNTKVQPLDYIYNGGMGGSVPFNARVFDTQRFLPVEPLIAEAMSSVADITAALFDGNAYYGLQDNRTTLSFTAGTPISLDGSQAFINVMFVLPTEIFYLTPLDFFLSIDCTGTDPSKYKFLGYITNEKFFPTAEKLRAAFKAGKLKQDFVPSEDVEWAKLNRKDKTAKRALEDQFAPGSIELGGKRYRLDAEQQYVEYMGWSFYISFSRMLGIQFYDIKFKGERVLYELSLQEAAAQYAGNQPKAASSG